MKLKHVFVTGPSGAGKSTLAVKMAKELQLPVVHMDRDPTWRDNLQSKPLMWVADPDSINHKIQPNVCKYVVERAISSTEQPSIIEGTQVLFASKKLLAAYRIVLLWPPEEVVVERRAMRRYTMAKEKGKPVPFDWCERLARAYYEYFWPHLMRVSDWPNVEIVI